MSSKTKESGTLQERIRPEQKDDKGANLKLYDKDGPNYNPSAVPPASGGFERDRPQSSNEGEGYQQRSRDREPQGLQRALQDHPGLHRVASSEGSGKEEEDYGTQVRGYQGGRQETGWQEGGRLEGGRQEGGRQEGSRQEHGWQAAIGQQGGRQERGRQESGRQQSGRQESGRQGGSRLGGGRQESSTQGEDWQQDAAGRYASRRFEPQQSRRYGRQQKQEQDVGGEEEHDNLQKLDGHLEQQFQELLTTFVSNSLEYMTLAGYCASPEVGMVNVARFFKLVTKCNRKAAKKIMKVVVARGGEVRFEDIDSPQSIQELRSGGQDENVLLPVFERVLKLECKEAELIRDIHSSSDNDPAFLPLIELISGYQCRHVFILNSMVTELRRYGDDGASLAFFDQSLGCRVDKWKCKMEKAKKAKKF